MEPTNTTQPQNAPVNTSAPAPKPLPFRRPRGKWFNRGIMTIVVLVLAVSATLIVQNRQHSAGATPIADVQITGNAFSPSTIKIKKNQTVTWTNADTATHEVASDPYPAHTLLSALVSSSLNQGDSYTFTFEKTGVFTYHDPINPTELKGTVIVE